MPIYEYKCHECDHVFEDLVLSSKDTGPEKCPKCGAAQVSRLISGTNFQLKGGGWFHSDYGKKGGAAVPDESSASVGEKSAGTSEKPEGAKDKDGTVKSGEKKTPAEAPKETKPPPVEKASPAVNTAASKPSA